MAKYSIVLTTGPLYSFLNGFLNASSLSGSFKLESYPLDEAEDDIADDDLGSGDASLRTHRHSSSHSDSVSVRPH